ncbi:MAG: hypothetical protein WDN69_36685 [Aliidongia sp.]
MQGALPLRIVIRLIVDRLELPDRFGRLGGDLFVFRQLRLAADAGIGRIIGRGCRRRGNDSTGPIIRVRRRRPGTDDRPVTRG